MRVRPESPYALETENGKGKTEKGKWELGPEAPTPWKQKKEKGNYFTVKGQYQEPDKERQGQGKERERKRTGFHTERKR